MNIVFLSDYYAPIIKSGAIIIKDLAIELSLQGNTVTIVTFSENQSSKFQDTIEDNIRVLRIKVASRKYGRLGRLWTEYRYSSLIIKNLMKLDGLPYDYIICYSPSIFYGKAIRWLKNNTKANAYLIIRDIFPEWAVDAGLLKKRIDRRLVDVSEIKLFSSNTQSARRVGNKMFKEVRQDINNFGFKLKHPPIALRQMADGTLQLANGRTRYQVLLERGFKNIIADIYTFTDNEASLFALKANAENDPAGDLQLEDVYDECCQAVENKWINKELNDIVERVEEACGHGKFLASSRRAVAIRVYNNYNSTQKVLYWNSKASINNWMKANNYIDTDNIEYMPVSYSIDKKAVVMAAERYVESGKQIRVVCHTGVLNASNIEDCYIDRVSDFKTLFNAHVASITSTYVEASGNKCKIKKTDNIILYGSLPAISTLHNDKDSEMKKMILFKKPN